MYRRDIDGLRTIAVLSVIFFHLGYLPNGYLGVDIFFVISGYLITNIIYSEAVESRFSIKNFYVRRVRRIIPLVLFTSGVALSLGSVVMLPDDFENLCQSVFATNFFSNNILLLITSNSYWAIINEFKPLMHTWSLGVEQQFYIFYPLIFLLFNGNKSRYILPTLIILTALSFILFCFETDEAKRFYLFQYRFFELAVGGIAAIFYQNRKSKPFLSLFFLITLVAILTLNTRLPGEINLFLTLICSIGLLIPLQQNYAINRFLLENKIMSAIGKISFSLYMWHQIILAYSRYFIFSKIGAVESIALLIVIFILSTFSYLAIEVPFRTQKKIGNKKLIMVSGFSLLVLCSTSFYLYTIGGIIRNVPELDIYKTSNKFNIGDSEKNIHIEYNANIYDLNKPFSSNDKIKVLIIGNSFARDFANIVLESDTLKTVEISYLTDIYSSPDIADRLRKAQFIFFSELSYSQFKNFEKEFNIDRTKVWNVGTKNFGVNNGIFYNKRRSDRYCKQKTSMLSGIMTKNQTLKTQWGERYIDLIGLIADSEGKVPVFTPDCKFISQDCSHLTQAGAVFLSKKLDIIRAIIK